MRNTDELVAVEQVCQRLVAQFPTVPVVTVRGVVQEIYATINGPVRDYVPLLVERGAKNRLSGLYAPHPPSGLGASQSYPLTADASRPA